MSPTQATFPGPSQGTETGQPDDTWLTLVRRRLDDWPKWANDTKAADGTSGQMGGGGVPYQVTGPKVMDGSFSVRQAGVSLTVDATYPPASGHAYVNYDTGEIFFGTVPGATVALSWDYQRVRFRDQEILEALTDGLREMWPAVGRVYNDDESLQIVPNQWDYLLPVAAQDYWSKILSVEVRDVNNAVEPWRSTLHWKKVGNERIFLFDAAQLSPAAGIRLTYWGPYTRLADLPTKLVMLPVWYALSALLPWRESRRTYDDRAVGQTHEGGQQPGLQIQTGDYYYQRFIDALNESKQIPPGSQSGFVTTYELGRGRRG